MRYMNEYEIDNNLARWEGHPVLGPATRTLANLRDAVNANSDGWAYWTPPGRAASRLMELIEGAPGKYYDDERADATPAALKVALRPLKTFRTKHPGVRFEIVEEFTPAESLAEPAAHYVVLTIGQGTPAGCKPASVMEIVQRALGASTEFREHFGGQLVGMVAESPEGPHRSAFRVPAIAGTTARAE